jgi:glycosyltransferase involved in cell wall biosynthesis
VESGSSGWSDEISDSSRQVSRYPELGEPSPLAPSPPALATREASGSHSSAALVGVRAALLHDWLTGFRGGERVLEAFCELLPHAPIYTLLHTPASTSERIEKRTIRTSFLNRLPGVRSNYRKLLPLMPRAAQRLKIADQTELVLSSHHCVIKGVPKPKGSVHVSYVHSPMRYMYDQYDTYFGPHASFMNRWGARVFRNYLVDWDIASNANVDVMIANSAFVRERIRRFYGRDAQVVHPFVDLADFAAVQAAPPSKSDYFVMVTALASNKRVDLAIEAFNRLGLPLVIIGQGDLDGQLRAMAGSTIRFLGNVNRATVIDVLARGRALIFPGVDDFGITPLEALAAKTPVIAFRSGGVLETLTEEDSVFFEEATTESLVKAVRRFDSSNLRPDVRRLNRFSRERFLLEIRDVIDGALNGARDARASGP